MGPVGGGRLSTIPQPIRELDSLSVGNAAELALRFVLAHPGVSAAISGMGSIEMVEQNCAAVDRGRLSDREIATISKMMDEMQELARLYCTGCQYCLPCPNGVNIPRVLELVNYYRVYGMPEHAIEQYRALVALGADAGQCVECGDCLERCPQHIEIPSQLKAAQALLAGTE